MAFVVLVACGPQRPAFEVFTAVATPGVECGFPHPQFKGQGPFQRHWRDGVQFFFLSKVVESDRESILEGVRLAQRYLRDGDDGRLQDPEGDLCVETYIDDGRDSGGSTGARLGTPIVIRTTSEGWRAPDLHFREWRLEQVTAHEYVHSWQVRTAGLGSPDRAEPRWLREGVAEYLSFRSLIHAGLISGSNHHATVIEDWQGVWNAASKNPPFDTLGVRRPLEWFVLDGNDYGLFHLAVEYLVSKSSVAALQEFYVHLGKPMAWQEAFTQAFKISPVLFYLDFSDYQERGYR